MTTIKWTNSSLMGETGTLMAEKRDGILKQATIK